jgi:hypothetical protein
MPVPYAFGKNTPGQNVQSVGIFWGTKGIYSRAKNKSDRKDIENKIFI